MFRFLLRQNEDGVYGVWDTKKRVYLTDADWIGMGKSFEEEDVRPIVDGLEAEYNSQLFAAFLRDKIAVWFKKKYALEFQRRFNRWLKAQGMDKRKTQIGFDPFRGYTVELTEG